jgi:hypothetical protein
MQVGNCLFTISLLDNQQSACLMRCFSNAEDEMPRHISVKLNVDPFNKRLTQLIDDTRLTICMLSVTAVRNTSKYNNLSIGILF